MPQSGLRTNNAGYLYLSLKLMNFKVVQDVSGTNILKRSKLIISYFHNLTMVLYPDIKVKVL